MDDQHNTLAAHWARGSSQPCKRSVHGLRYAEVRRVCLMPSGRGGNTCWALPLETSAMGCAATAALDCLPLLRVQRGDISQLKTMCNIQQQARWLHARVSQGQQSRLTFAAPRLHRAPGGRMWPACRELPGALSCEPHASSPSPARRRRSRSSPGGGPAGQRGEASETTSNVHEQQSNSFYFMHEQLCSGSCQPKSSLPLFAMQMVDEQPAKQQASQQGFVA